MEKKSLDLQRTRENAREMMKDKKEVDLGGDQRKVTAETKGLQCQGRLYKAGRTRKGLPRQGRLFKTGCTRKGRGRFHPPARLSQKRDKIPSTGPGFAEGGRQASKEGSPQQQYPPLSIGNPGS